MSAIAWLLLILTSILEVAGDVVLKTWAENNKVFLLYVGAACFVFAAIAWAFSLRLVDLSKASCLVSAIIILISVLFGVLFFKETLTTVQKFGVVLTLISMWMVGD